MKYLTDCVQEDKDLYRDISCVYCLGIPDIDDIFVSKCDEFGWIEISLCGPCSDIPTSKKEKNGYWIVLQRTLGGFEILD